MEDKEQPIPPGLHSLPKTLKLKLKLKPSSINKTSNIIPSQMREATKDDPDVFSERADPNALKEHLLKMTTQHRALMAVKRGKSTTLDEEGNVEIGTGYGCSVSNSTLPSHSISGTNETGHMNFEPDKNIERKPPSKEMSEYLKKKLRAMVFLRMTRAKKIM